MKDMEHSKKILEDELQKTSEVRQESSLFGEETYTLFSLNSALPLKAQSSSLVHAALRGALLIFSWQGTRISYMNLYSVYVQLYTVQLYSGCVFTCVCWFKNVCGK